MSRTLRKVTSHSYNESARTIVVDDSKAKFVKSWRKPPKLKPYAKAGMTYNGRYKRGTHYVPGTFHTIMGNTRAETKLENNNANRSVKKGMRQFLKKDLKKQLEEL